MSVDLFGNETAPAVEAGELFEGAAPGLREELARLRERMIRAKHKAALAPGSSSLQQKYAEAKRDYLALRDHRGGLSQEEVSAGLVASGEAAPPPCRETGSLL